MKQTIEVYDVLHVEDDAALRRSLRGALSARSIILHPADGLTAALELATDDVPWCGVIADYHLAEGNGLEVVAALRDRYPRLPAVVVTGDEGRAVNHACALARIVNVRKPFRVRHLEPFIEEVVEFVRGPYGPRMSALLRDKGATPREGEIVRVVLDRSPTRRQLARHFGVSENTIKTHIQRVLSKAGVRSFDELRDLLERREHA